jgi:hypothetical protein
MVIASAFDCIERACSSRGVGVHGGALSELPQLILSRSQVLVSNVFGGCLQCRVLFLGCLKRACAPGPGPGGGCCQEGLVEGG